MYRNCRYSVYPVIYGNMHVGKLNYINFRVLINDLFPEPLVEIKSSPFVELSVRKHEGNLQIHLVNTSGDHRHTIFFESIEPVRDIEVSVRLDKKPEKITCQPDGKDIKFKYKNGKAIFKIDSLDIYDIIEISGLT